MSIYYHTFQIGFNFWFIALPFLLIVCAAVSTMSETQFFWAEDLNAGRRLIRYRRHRCDSTICVLQAVAAITSTMTVVALICLESWNGIVQYCRNYIATGDDILATADAAAVVIVIACAIIVLVLMAWAVNSGWRLAAAAVLVFDAVLVLAARYANSRPVKGPDSSDDPDQQDETDSNPRS